LQQSKKAAEILLCKKKQIALRTGRKENRNFNKKGQKHLLNISKAIWTSLETKRTGKLT